MGVTTQERPRAVWVSLPRDDVPGFTARAGGFRWGALVLLAVVAGLLIFCHGCHNHDIDDELFSRGWW